MPFLRQLFDADTFSFTYLLADVHRGEALLIDPVIDHVERDLRLLRELGLRLRYALDTHVHADHVTGVGALRERTGCITVAGALGPESAGLRLADGEELGLGSLRLRVIATPGHTDCSVTYAIDDQLFTGDALLVRGCGRTDFQNGDAGQLYDSITERLFRLPESTRVWPAHDYQGFSVTTIGEEIRWNARVAGRNRAEFVALMSGLKLAPPKRIQASVPANRELGLGKGPDQASGRFAEWDGDETARHLGSVRVIDVREQHEFDGQLGHIPGAEHVPMGTFPGAAADWDHEQPLLCVCRSGRRSRQVCEQLADMGFRSVANLRGGMLEYRERGHAVERTE